MKNIKCLKIIFYFDNEYSIEYELLDGTQKNNNGNKYTYRAKIFAKDKFIESYLTNEFANKSNAKRLVKENL